MNPSLILPELFSRGDSFRQSTLLQIERDFAKSSLDCFRFCRDLLMPIPLAWKASRLWEEIGKSEHDEKLLTLASDIRQWVCKWKNSANYLFYRESEFQEAEIRQLESVQLNDSPIDYASDEYLGMVGFAAPSVAAAFTLSGWNSSLGVMKIGQVEIRACGPQGFSLSDGRNFGLSQIGAQQPVMAADSQGVSLQGWTRCYQNREIWLFLNASVSSQAVSFDVRWVGLQPDFTSEDSAAISYALAFYVKASKCIMADGFTLYPKDLQRYQGKVQKIIFDQQMQIECSKPLKLQVIPLAGQGCFWNADFLVSFEFDGSCDRASFSIR